MSVAHSRARKRERRGALRVPEARQLVDDAREIVDTLTGIQQTGEGTEAERADVVRALAEAKAGLHARLCDYNEALRRSGGGR